MDFQTYISDMRRRLELASALGCSPVYLYQIASRRRRASTTLAQGIERESGGVVTKESLRPDVWGSPEHLVIPAQSEASNG